MKHEGSMSLYKRLTYDTYYDFLSCCLQLPKEQDSATDWETAAQWENVISITFVLYIEVDFHNQIRYFSMRILPKCPHEDGWTMLQNNPLLKLRNVGNSWFISQATWPLEQRGGRSLSWPTSNPLRRHLWAFIQNFSTIVFSFLFYYCTLIYVISLINIFFHIINYLIPWLMEPGGSIPH